MKRLLLAVILLTVVFLFSSCASVPMSVLNENFVIPSDFAGIVHAGRTGTREEFDYLNYLGVSWVLDTFRWSRIEPEQGEWNFSRYDANVDNNRAAGIKVLGVLAYDTEWIHEDGKIRDYIPPHRLPDFLRFVRNTVEHFRGRVDAWCIWNEPNLFWNGTDDEFVELSRQAADAVREVDTEVILLGGAFNRGVFGLPERFIRKLFESGAMDKVDAVAFHPYELNPSRLVLLYDRFRKIVDDYGFGDKIWVTEVGYPTGGWYPTKVREDRLPEYVIKTFVLLAASGSNKMLWYQLFDPDERSDNDSEDYFGLVRSRRDYTSKGAEAFRLCANYLQGSTRYVQEPGSNGIPNSIRMFWFRGNGGGALVLWNESFGSKQISLQLPGTDHTRHDPFTGNTVSIQAGTVFDVGTMPVFITWQDAVTPAAVPAGGN
ncbi:MAG: beta-galactosidase [Treponema sp.]|jgi:hypothetical protein|nr:beta-galactosidase [Treponema sp.]